MSEAFIHTCYVEGYWPQRDHHFGVSSLIGETIAVYYWCEWFFNTRHGHRKQFCVVGQRGLSEYVATITPKIIEKVSKRAISLNEEFGYQYGAVVALREALRDRRDAELQRPEYMDQCNSSTYRARKQLNHLYKIGARDHKVDFDLDSFRRGRCEVWTLTQFKSPIDVLNDYARRNHVEVI